MLVAPYRYISVRIRCVILSYFLVFLFLGCTEKVVRLNHFADLFCLVYRSHFLSDHFQAAKMYKALLKCRFDKIMCNSFTFWEVK